MFERNTELAPAADIRRRLFYLLVVIAVPVGALLIVQGATSDRTTLTVIGGVLVAVALGAGWVGRALIAKTKAELQHNPFKAPRIPRE